VIINGTLHTINDLPGVLVQIRRALKPDGLLLCALIGGETLHELRDALTEVEVAMFGGAAPRVHPMIDLPTISALMQRAGFALPVVDTDLRVIFYKKLRTLLKDIKASGEGLALAQRSRKYMGRDFWDGVEAYYKARHAEADGLLRASIEVLYAIGWAPADSQQKPLKPGQAKNRLADALGTIEGALPDKPKP
jgi:SAM-dependent methyltransferase